MSRMSRIVIHSESLALIVSGSHERFNSERCGSVRENRRVAWGSGGSVAATSRFGGRDEYVAVDEGKATFQPNLVSRR